MISIRIAFKSHPCWLGLVRGVVRQAGRTAGFPRRDIQNMTLAVDEACTNVIRHGYEGRTDKPMSLECKLKKFSLEFLLKDKGIPADSKKMKSRSLDEIRPGGLGLFFMEKMMDQVVFGRSRGVNILRMVKNAKKK